MYRKPFPIIILAIIHMLEPLGKLIFYSWFGHLPIAQILQHFDFRTNPIQSFLFYFPFPIAGVAIYSVKKWSLPVFLIVEALALVNHVRAWTIAPKFIPFSLAFTLSNLLVTTYFLVPAVRIAYLDPRIRWWESQTRYFVNWKGILFNGKEKIEGWIDNFSIGGIFFRPEKNINLDADATAEIEFSMPNLNFRLKGMVRHSKKLEGVTSFGIQFTDVAPADRHRLKKCIQAIDLLGFERRPNKEPFLLALIQWAIVLLKTGRGIFPEINKR